jgi:hypothetical protein
MESEKVEIDHRNINLSLGFIKRSILTHSSVQSLAINALDFYTFILSII